MAGNPGVSDFDSHMWWQVVVLFYFQTIRNRYGENSLQAQGGAILLQTLLPKVGFLSW